jgi:cytoskeletal protein CcmA (bactofilin family)
MFKEKSKTSKSILPAISPSIIGEGSCITGDIASEGDIRIDGTVKGNVISKAKVLVGPSGTIEGDMHCIDADISGNICGKIVAKGLLFLKGNAVVSGDIHTNKLVVEPTAKFNGQCHMGANILELKNTLPLAVNE